MPFPFFASRDELKENRGYCTKILGEVKGRAPLARALRCSLLPPFPCGPLRLADLNSTPLPHLCPSDRRRSLALQSANAA